jgi:hypothetical protein
VVVDAAAEFGPGAFTGVLELVRGKIRRDPGRGTAGGVAGPEEADPGRVHPVVSGGVPNQVREGPVEAK